MFSKIKEAIEKRNECDLFNKAFLKPIEISLKTYETELANPENSVNCQAGCLPFGIKQVIKQMSIDDNKYVLRDFVSFSEAIQNQNKVQLSNLHQNKNKVQDVYDINYIQMNSLDNMISLIKKKPIQKDKKQIQTSTIKVAICICMFSEDKYELKKTLESIKQNIIQFHKNGIQPNEIGVFVIMDGIEHVNNSVDDIFTEFQMENHIYLGGEVERVSPQQLMDESRETEDEQVSNINHFVFTQEQLQDRENRTFIRRKNEYKENKLRIQRIQQLQKNKALTYQLLSDTILQKFFLDQAKEEYKKQYGCSDDEIKNMKDQNFIERFTLNTKTALPLLRKSLAEAKNYCREYIISRDKLALLNCFRVDIESLKTQKKTAQPHNLTHENLLEDSDGSLNSSCLKMNLFMVAKYKNGGKLSSHNWFFNGFCKELNPEFAILIDVGLSPEKHSLVKMVKYMMTHQKVGGVCGYMGLKIQKVQDHEEVQDDNVDCVTRFFMKFVDIQRAQQFQYHFAHLIDKPFQSCFDFIHVLPGAFSAYRMDAIFKQGSKDKELLKQYFKSLEDATSGKNYVAKELSGVQTFMKVVLPDFLYSCCYEKPQDDSQQKLLYDENVYLAEDRTLCMGIHVNGYELVYIPDANARVDPIKSLHGLLGQRKRWINGSFFAFDKVKAEIGTQSESNDCFLRIQILYLTLMNMLSFIAPALFMFTIHIAMYTFQSNVIVAVFQQLGVIGNSVEARQNYVVGIFVYVVDFIYVMMFLGLIFYSMHLNNKDKQFMSFFYGVSTAYGVFSLAVFGVLIFDIISGFTGTKNAFLIQNPWFVDEIAGGLTLIDSLRYIMIGIMGLYLFPILIFLIYRRFDYIIDVIFSTFSFIFYSPTYLNILNIYAICRIDDISWGTKGLDTEDNGKNKKMQEQWKKIKILHVCKYVLYNLVVGFLLLIFGDRYVVRFYLTLGIMVVIGFMLLVKVLLACFYLLTFKCRSDSMKGYDTDMPPFKDDLWNNFQKTRTSILRDVEKNINQTKAQFDQTNIQNKMQYSKVFSVNSQWLQGGRKGKKNTKQQNVSFNQALQSQSKIQRNFLKSNVKLMPIDVAQIKLGLQNSPQKSPEKRQFINNKESQQKLSGNQNQQIQLTTKLYDLPPQKKNEKKVSKKNTGLLSRMQK